MLHAESVEKAPKYDYQQIKTRWSFSQRQITHVCI